MSATRYQIGFSSIGIQSIVPTTGTSRRVTKRNPMKIAAPTTAAPSPIKNRHRRIRPSLAN
jgi:hypothetical protein